MQVQAPSLSFYNRVIALLALLLGLNDASRLLGVNLGDVSPVAVMGFYAFVYLAVFCLARLFAAVGLWIGASWGAVLLVGTTALELLLYVIGNPDIRMSGIGFGMRVVLLLAMLAVFGLTWYGRRAQAAD